MFCIGFNQGYAQKASTASCGDASGSGGTAPYSVGQIAYTTYNGTTGSVAQGVQQPYEISVTVGLEELGINLDLSAYPNPTTDYLILQIDASTTLINEPLSYELYDIFGKLIERNQIAASRTTIDMAQLARATYFLKVIQDNKEVKTFKVIKN